MDVSKDWTSRVWLGDEKVGIWQEVVVENPPFCSCLGHNSGFCLRKHPELENSQIKPEAQKVQDPKVKLAKAKETWKVKENQLAAPSGVPVPGNKDPEMQRTSSQGIPHDIHAATWKAAGLLGIALTLFAKPKPKQPVIPSVKSVEIIRKGSDNPYNSINQVEIQPPLMEFIDHSLRWIKPDGPNISSHPLLLEELIGAANHGVFIENLPNHQPCPNVPNKLQMVLFDPASSAQAAASKVDDVLEMETLQAQLKGLSKDFFPIR